MRNVKRTDLAGHTAVLPNAQNAEDTGGNGKAKIRATDAKEDDGLSFWEYLSSLEDKWSTGNLKMYIYRVWPVIDKRESQVYLCQVQEPVDEDYLLRNLGSGRYLLMVKDRSKLLRKHTMSVHNQAYPPRVDESEVLTDPRNDSYFKVWKKPNGTGRFEKEPLAQTDVNTVLTTVLEKTGSFDPKLADLWEKTARERDELSKALAAKNAPPDLLAVARGLKELFPPQPPPAAEKDLLAVITAIKDLRQDPLAVMQQAKELFAPVESERGSGGESDEIDRLDKVLGFAQKLAALRLPTAGPQRMGCGPGFFAGAWYAHIDLD
jgi:hypothetical protein